MPIREIVKVSRPKRSAKIVVQKVVKQTKAKKKTKRRRRGGKLGGGLDSLTPAGLAFLKCTMAPADFTKNSMNFTGIPDEFEGKVITRSYDATNSLPSYTTGNDLYLVCIDSPHVAYMWGQRAAGSTGAITLTPVYYDGVTSLFPNNAESTNVTDFRFASNVIEVECTNNEMTYGGQIQQWKSELEMVETTTGTLSGTMYPDAPIIEGWSTLNTVKPSYARSIKVGCYSPNFNRQASYEWKPIRVNTPWSYINANQAAQASDENFVTVTSSNTFLGLGSRECTVIKFPAIIASQTAIIRSWACVEYMVNPTSIIYDYAHDSPKYDPLALALLKAYQSEMKSAVDVAHNGTFWSEFVDWARKAATVVSFIPGPVGAIASGFKDLLELGHGLF